MRKKEQETIFHKWIEEFQPLLFKIVKVYGSESNEEQDLFQEVVIQLWKSIKTFKNQCSEHTWIYRVALNTAIKWSARSKKKRTEPLEQKYFIVENKQQVDPKLDWLYAEISKMDSIDRSLTMLLLDGFSYKEMSGILGIKPSHVGVKINRIKKKLQRRAKLLENEY